MRVALLEKQPGRAGDSVLVEEVLVTPNDHNLCELQLFWSLRR